MEDFVIENGVLIEYKGNGGDIVIPDGVTKIGKSAFNGCVGLVSIEIPNSVTEIESCAFWNCDGLASITIPNSITSIGEGAFYGCNALVSITIPNSIISIEGAFNGCNGLENITVENGNPLYHSAGNCLIRTGKKELILGCCNSIIPNDGTVNRIGDDAFENCEKLASINIPDGITEIGDDAFRFCSSLESVTIPKTVSLIDGFVFFYCKGIKKFTDLSSISAIKYLDDTCKLQEGFMPNVNLAELTTSQKMNAVVCYLSSMDLYSVESQTTYNEYIKRQIKKIFEECIKRNSMSCIKRLLSSGFVKPDLLKKTINVVENEEIKAFLMDYQNNNFDLSNEQKKNGKHIERSLTEGPTVSELKTLWSTKKLENGNFIITSYKGLEENIVVPEFVGKNKIEQIGESAFSPDGRACNNSEHRYSGIKSVIIPKGVTRIGEGAFSSCINVEEILLPNGVTNIGEAAFSCCQSISSMRLPNSITNIGESAFSLCSELVSVILPTGITCIQNDTFGDCYSLESIEIPDGVKSIGDNAFSDCYNLISISIPESVTSIGDSAFNNCKSLTAITIPDSVTSIGE